MRRRRLESINHKCSEYLKQKPTLRIMKGFRNKYRSYGDIRGIFELKNPTVEEKEFLKGVFKKDFSERKSISISLLKFQESFNETLYEGIDLAEVLNLYFGETIISKKSETELATWNKKIFFEKLISNLRHENLKTWIAYVFENSSENGYKLINKLYSESTIELEKLIFQLESVLYVCETHEDGIAIPMAAALAALDPHGLDEGTVLKKLLIYYICYSKELNYPENAQEKAEILEGSNLLTSDSIRNCITYGIKAFDKYGNSLDWEKFYLRNEPLTLVSYNLKNVNILKSEVSKVYCFENPTVFYHFIKNNPNLAAICTNGQINTLVYKVLDKLFESGEKLCYSGDFDPEGILIADKLKTRYADLDVSFFNKLNYENSVSNNFISEVRLKQLDKIKDSFLKEIANNIKVIKKAGYEELCKDLFKEII